jgi:hypothetical protein
MLCSSGKFLAQPCSNKLFKPTALRAINYGHILFCAGPSLSEAHGKVLHIKFPGALLRHCPVLLQRIRRGFEELGEAILVDGFLVGLFRRNPFLCEEIVDRVIQGLHG